MVPRKILALLLPVLAWSAACSVLAPHVERPILSVTGVELLDGNLFQQNFRVNFNVQNPNDRALPVTGVHAELSVLGERVASGVVDHAFVVPAFGSSQFDMTISANLANLVLKLAGRANDPSDDIDYELSGAAGIDLPFLREVPFHQRGRFSAGSLH